MPGWLREAGRVTYGTFLAKGNMADFGKPCMTCKTICSQSCMRQREHNASNEDDNILAARKDEHCFRTMLCCCNSSAEFRGCLQARRNRGRSPL